MELKEQILLMTFSIAIFTPVFCSIVLLAKLIFSVNDSHTKKISTLLIAFYWVITLLHLSIYLFNFNTEAHIIASMILLCLLLTPVIFYNIIYTITKLDNRFFPKKNYVPAIVIYLIYTIWGFVVSPKNQSSSFSLHFFVLVSIGYTYLYLFYSAKKILIYKKQISSYSSEIEASSLEWINKIFVCLIVLYVPIPVFYFLSEKGSITEYITYALFNSLFFILDILFCYNIFTQNFVSINKKDLLSEDENRRYGKVLNKKVFEKYLEIHKPYLDYKLKISELALFLGTNRTYLSSFINDNYSMNFSTYINKKRLEEMERLRQFPSYKDLPEADLLLIVGFKSYNSYKKAKDVLKTKL